MQKLSRFALLFSGLFAVAVVVARIILGGWHEAMWVPLGLSVFFFFFGVFTNWRMMLDFFILKTTKHGMNMGVLILTFLVLLVVVNFLAVSQDKKWDFTSEGLNSLSEQSIKAVQSLTADTELVFLFRRGEGDEQNRRMTQDLANMYTAAGPKLKFKMHNALERPDLAKQLEFTSGQFGLFLVQGEKRQKVEQITEEEVTRALLRLSKEKRKSIYFTVGHGEADLNGRTAEGLAMLKRDLESSYEVKTLELFKDTKVPDDAELVVVAGPRQRFLPAEADALFEYAKRGGSLILGLDPDAEHGLEGLVKKFGIEYQGNFVLDPRAMIPGRGNVAALGTNFSSTAEATRPLTQGYAVFMLSSAVNKSPDAPQDFRFDDLVRTDERAIGTPSLEMANRMQRPGPHTLMLSAKGKLPGAEKEFEVVVAGDSDFMRNEMYRGSLNRDLATNMVSALAKDTDLVSIKPKMPKGTALYVTNTQLMIILFAFCLPVPILSFFMGGFLWWRRKSA